MSKSRKNAKILVSEATIKTALAKAEELLGSNPELEDRLRPYIDGLNMYLNMSNEELTAFNVNSKEQLLDDEVAPDFVQALKNDIQDIAGIVREFGPMDLYASEEEPKEAAAPGEFNMIQDTVTYLRQNKAKLKNLLNMGGQAKLMTELQQKTPAGAQKGMPFVAIVNNWLNGAVNDSNLVHGIEKLFNKVGSQLTEDGTEIEMFDNGQKEHQLMADIEITASDMAMLSDDEVLDAYAKAEEEIENGDMFAYQDLKACEKELDKRGLKKASAKTAAPQAVTICEELEYAIKDLILEKVRVVQKKIRGVEGAEEAASLLSKLDDTLTSAHGLAKQCVSKVDSVMQAKKESAMANKDPEVEELEELDPVKKDHIKEPKDASLKITACVHDMNEHMENGGMENYIDHAEPEEMDFLIEELPSNPTEYPNLTKIKDMLTNVLDYVGELEGAKFSSFKLACDHGHAQAPDDNLEAFTDHTDLGVDSFYKDMDTVYASLASSEIFHETNRLAARRGRKKRFKDEYDLVRGHVSEHGNDNTEAAEAYIMSLADSDDSFEDYTVADLLNKMTAKGFTIQITHKALESALGPEALLVLSTPVEELLK